MKSGSVKNTFQGVTLIIGIGCNDTFGMAGRHLQHAVQNLQTLLQMRGWLKWTMGWFSGLSS